MMMKIKQILKIIFYIILINSFENLNTEAHISHYKNLKKIEMEIFRNDKLIGYNYYFFKKNKDTTLVTNQIKFAVNILGATMFESRDMVKNYIMEISLFLSIQKQHKIKKKNL